MLEKKVSGKSVYCSMSPFIILSLLLSVTFVNCANLWLTFYFCIDSASNIILIILVSRVLNISEVKKKQQCFLPSDCGFFIFLCARSSERSCERKLKKNVLFLERFFFPSSERLNFEEKNVIFQNIFSNFNLFYGIVVNFLSISFIWTLKASGRLFFLCSFQRIIRVTTLNGSIRALTQTREY